MLYDLSSKNYLNSIFLCHFLTEAQSFVKWGRFSEKLPITLKGQSNEIFDPQFFSSFEPAWATDQWVKTVWFLVSFSPRYSYFSWVPRSMILRRVKFRAVSYCAKSCDFSVSFRIKQDFLHVFYIIRVCLCHLVMG